MENRTQYEVQNLATLQSHGYYGTLDEARGCVAYDRLKEWRIIGRAAVIIEEWNPSAEPCLCGNPSQSECREDGCVCQPEDKP